MSLSVTQRLVRFAREQQAAGVPEPVLHEARRLVINQLKASVCALDSDAVVRIRQWCRGTPGQATGLWFGDRLGAEQACVLNAAVFEVLDFNETHIPTFQHAVSGVLPAVLAKAEALGSSGAAVVEALALGIEVELACATILMPTGYFRGFIPGGITGAIGGALACSLLAGHDDEMICDALGIAMNCGVGVYHTAGSPAFSYIMGHAARAGLTASDMAGLGLSAPVTTFEGDKGMLSAYSDEPAGKIEPVLAELGHTWRILAQSYKTVPTETITHGPIECVAALRPRAAGREVKSLRFAVAPIVVKIADERGERFGVPSTELEAKFDLRHCVAAAWVRERFGLDEMRQGAFTDPAIIDLRARTVLTPDAAQDTFYGGGLEVEYTDGSTDRHFTPAFRGTPQNPMTDDELSDVFRRSAEGHITPEQAEAVLTAAWRLSEADSVRDLIDATIIA